MNNKPNATTVFFDPAGDDACSPRREETDRLFGIPVTQYEPKIFVVALRYAPVREDTKDIVQQNFPKGFIHLHRFEGKSSFFACRSKT